MKIHKENNITIIEEAFNTVSFVSTKGEPLDVILKDGGFEVVYQGRTYEFKPDVPLDLISKVITTGEYLNIEVAFDEDSNNNAAFLYFGNTSEEEIIKTLDRVYPEWKAYKIKHQ